MDLWMIYLALSLNKICIIIWIQLLRIFLFLKILKQGEDEHLIRILFTRQIEYILANPSSPFPIYQ